jgi:hypothetical protein
MFPDTDELSIYVDVIADRSTSPLGYHTSAVPDLMMQTLIAGLQDMSRQQSVTTQEDHLERRRFENDLKALLEHVPIVDAIPH